MERLASELSRIGSILNKELAGGVLTDASISGSDGVDHILVHGPDLVPLLQVGVLGGSLLEHEVFEGFHSHTSSHDALDGGEARVVPPSDVALINEPSEFTLREHGGDQVQL